MPEEKSLSQLTKKELYDKCAENVEIKNEFNKFKEQVNEYKIQLEVRANYIQKLQYERDQLLEQEQSPVKILENYKQKLYKDKTKAEDKYNTLVNIIESL